ncbi:MAG TPA: DUF2314 domain-containing protein [Opitutaceae bacterium]|nr:DUF2314 domain-containing protein [Opitutaceae bacterium]
MTSPRSSWLATFQARVAIVGVVLGFSGVGAWRLNGSGHGLAALFAGAAGIVAAIWIWRKLHARALAAAEAPMVSLVLLLKQPRYLEARVLAEILRSAWGISFSTGGGDGDKRGSEEPFIVGETPIFLVQTGTTLFIVHNHERSYFDDVDEVAKGVPELRLRSIVQEHRAWLSVDAMGVEGAAETAAAYAKISRALAEFADDSVLGLLQPANNRLTPWESELEARLRRGENLDELFAATQAPVVQIMDDDPRMLAAVAEARQRWPEFVAALQARKPGGNYAVKAPVTREDHTEFIWIEVVGLEPEYIHGTLANDPVNLGGLKFGDRVEVPLAELNDWIYQHAEGEEPRGLFTVRILTHTFKKQIDARDG